MSQSRRKSQLNPSQSPQAFSDSHERFLARNFHLPLAIHANKAASLIVASNKACLWAVGAFHAPNRPKSNGNASHLFPRRGHATKRFLPVCFGNTSDHAAPIPLANIAKPRPLTDMRIYGDSLRKFPTKLNRLSETNISGTVYRGTLVVDFQNHAIPFYRTGANNVSPSEDTSRPGL